MAEADKSEVVMLKRIGMTRDVVNELKKGAVGGNSPKSLKNLVGVGQFLSEEEVPPFFNRENFGPNVFLGFLGDPQKFCFLNDISGDDSSRSHRIS